MIRFTITAENHAHDVLVGPLADAAATIVGMSSGRPLPLVTDDHIWALHGAAIEALFDVERILVPRGEQAKTWDSLCGVAERLLELGATRDTPILALGGGSVGDLAGLAASLFKRGCPVIHIPTTLLAQADSALGGKTAIDAFGHKNLIGTFHPPALVVADIAFLDTLDDRQLRAGFAEVVKYGLIGDPDFFAWCEAHGSALIDGDRAARLHAVEYCLRAKAGFVADDLRDRAGRRALLNLGHTFGHAIEAAAGLGEVLHGEAVAIGMVLAFALSAELGLCSNEDKIRAENHFIAVGLPNSLNDVGVRPEALMQFLLHDKKAGHAGLALILVHGIGHAFVSRDVAPDRLAAFLASAA